MIGALRAERRRIDRLARAVRDDAAAVAAARAVLAARLGSELARPPVLLALFAAGVGAGWLRPLRGRVASQDEGALTAGTFARAIAVVTAGARLFDQVRRAAALIAPVGGETRPDATPEPYAEEPYVEESVDESPCEESPAR